ncbi:MAG: hydantoinase B/oxoprolinase family protein [Alphaproteobacteria bacterium]|nr:hydantoinase B/oxoprolinase family protein [Alphaproteobacteria bacterium]
MTKSVDPVLVEIVRNGVMAVTEEMKTNLMRTAYNMIIYEALDFTVGLFTADGQTVSIGLGLPTFIRGMAETIKAELKHFGKENIEPGDILLTNDAYITGSHLNHMTFSLPIFHDGELIAFACCMAHWQDVGGQLGGVTTDIFSEGIQIPVIKYARRGTVNQDLVDIIRMNVRIPERAMGDLRAQITAVKTGEKRFLELVTRYGRAEVLQAIQVIMDQSERAARARTSAIPDGIYEAQSFMDDDGVNVGAPIPIKVRVEVKGDEMIVDLSDVSRQVHGFYNSGITTGHACAQVAFKCLTSPRDYPINDGSFRNLTVIVPPGRVVSATRPAPMRWWMTFPMTVIDTVFKALGDALPDKVIAGHHADLCVSLVHGIDPKDGKFFLAHMGPLGGGWGAKLSEDGVSATVCINDGDTHNSPREQLEAKYPLLIERYALIEDSGGPGQHRGGLGCETVIRALTDVTMNASIDRAHCLPWGLHGGLEGTGNQVLLRRDGEWDKERANAKVLTVQLKKGDAYALRSGGGGGFGSPLDRPAGQVREDVQQGYVSRVAARDYYGVVLDPETLEINEAATADERAAAIPVHQKRVAAQGQQVRRLSAAELTQKPPGHAPIPCLRISCCGMVSFPFLENETPD